MVSELDYGSRGPGSSPGRVICVVFLGKEYIYKTRSINGYQQTVRKT